MLVSILACASTAAPAAHARTGTGAHRDRDRAAALTRNANRLYRSGHADAAVRLYRRAYELSSAPELLFNLGQCHRVLGHDDRAVFYYSLYLRERPDAPNRRLAIELLAEVSAAAQGVGGFRAHDDAVAIVHRTRSVDARLLRRDRDPADEPVYHRWWFWTAVATAAVLTGATVHLATDSR